MKNKIKIAPLALLFFVNFSCFDDGDTFTPKGTLKITVKTSSDIWGFPVLKSGSTTDYKAYNGDGLYQWKYPDVGGDGNPADEESLYNTPISFDDIGDKKNIIYLYSAIGETSSTYPVLYKGVSENNNETIVVTGIEPGEYFVTAFYDYSSGGNLENQLNRYDRYGLYTTVAPIDSSNSTPYQDDASTITISGDLTTEITIEIKQNWVLGKPKTTDGGTGRIFLKSSESIPVP
jgi:hypothetical protein